MLRLVVIGVSGLIFVGALVLAVVEPLARVWPTVFTAGLIFAGVLFERFVYKPLHRRKPGPDWQATGERFIDPASQRPVQVYFRPGDGKRMYVSED